MLHIKIISLHEAIKLTLNNIIVIILTYELYCRLYSSEIAFNIHACFILILIYCNLIFPMDNKIR